MPHHSRTITALCVTANPTGRVPTWVISGGSWPPYTGSAYPPRFSVEADMAAWLLRAIWRPEQVQQTEQAYSITSSAVASSAGGTVRPLRVPRFSLKHRVERIATRTGDE